MVELVVLPNGPSTSSSKGKKPAPPPQQNKRLSIKDYFAVTDSSASESSSKKRKSTTAASDAASAPTKKPRKPTTTTAKKSSTSAAADESTLSSSIVDPPAQASDKENNNHQQAQATPSQKHQGYSTATEVEGDDDEDTTTDTPPPAAVKKQSGPTSTTKAAAAKNSKQKEKTGAGVTKAKAKPKVKLNPKPKQSAATVSVSAAAAAAAVKQSSEKAQPESEVEAEVEQTIVVQPQQTPQQQKKESKAHAFLNAYFAAKEKSGKEPDDTDTDLEELTEMEDSELEQVIKSPGDKKGGATAAAKAGKEKKEKKEKVPKAPKAPKEPKTPKTPKTPKEPKEKKEKIPKEKKEKTPKEPKEKKPKPEKTPKEKKEKDKQQKKEKNPSEIKQWKQYEPKGNSVAQYFQPAPQAAVPQPPKFVAPPPLEHIEISFPLAVIHDRLIVREFVLRFEKTLKLLPRYVQIVNNPNSEWTDLTYKSLICCFLRVIATDDYPPLDWDILVPGSKEISDTPPDDPKIWVVLQSMLQAVGVEGLNGKEVGATGERSRLRLLVQLLMVTAGTALVRARIEEDGVLAKKEERAVNEQIKALRAEWDVLKQEKAKQRFTLTAGEELAAFEQKYAREQSYMRRQIALLESRVWFRKRKLCPRERPLGVDALGNTYWLFGQREKGVEDWGRWIVVEKERGLVHPWGVMPSGGEKGKEEGGEDQEEEEDEEEKKRRVWYAISTADEATALAKWITYTAEMVFYERTLKPHLAHTGATSFPPTANATSSSSSSSSAAVSGGAAQPQPASPTRQRLQAVEVPLSPGMRSLMKSDPEEARKLFTVAEPERLAPREAVTRKQVEDLVGGLKRVAGFWRLEEDGVDGGKLAV